MFAAQKIRLVDKSNNKFNAKVKNNFLSKIRE